MVSRWRGSYEKKKNRFPTCFFHHVEPKTLSSGGATPHALTYYIHRQQSDVIDDSMVRFGSIYNNAYYNGGGAEEI